MALYIFQIGFFYVTSKISIKAIFFNKPKSKNRYLINNIYIYFYIALY